MREVRLTKSARGLIARVFDDGEQAGVVRGSEAYVLAVTDQLRCRPAGDWTVDWQQVASSVHRRRLGQVGALVPRQ